MSWFKLIFGSILVLGIALIVIAIIMTPTTVTQPQYPISTIYTNPLANFVPYFWPLGIGLIIIGTVGMVVKH